MLRIARRKFERKLVNNELLKTADDVVRVPNISKKRKNVYTLQQDFRKYDAQKNTILKHRRIMIISKYSDLQEPQNGFLYLMGVGSVIVPHLITNFAFASF